jgi:hypothetical protein
LARCGPLRHLERRKVKKKSLGKIVTLKIKFHPRNRN